MISLSKPVIDRKDIINVVNCLAVEDVSAYGRYVRKFESLLEDCLCTNYAVATSNGTAALHLALESLQLPKGSEVIVPSLTFIASVNAISMAGLCPTFVDSGRDLQIDMRNVSNFLRTTCAPCDDGIYNKLTGRLVSAIMPVHLLGYCCHMTRVRSLAKKYNIKIIEDASQALGVIHKQTNKHAGSIGDVGCISFNGNKIITCGAGGAVITNDSKIAKRANSLRSHAKIDGKYKFSELGWNYTMPAINAALGYSQLIGLRRRILKKKEITNWYNKYITYIADYAEHVTPLVSSIPNYWLYTIVLDKEKVDIPINYIVAVLQDNDIESRAFWSPVHKMDMYLKYYSHNIEYANVVYNYALSLPTHIEITEEDVYTVMSTLGKILRGEL